MLMNVQIFDQSACGKLVWRQHGLVISSFVGKHLFAYRLLLIITSFKTWVMADNSDGE